MRDPGWYWVKMFENEEWQVAKWNGYWWDKGNFEPPVIGPRIEEPKEE